MRKIQRKSPSFDLSPQLVNHLFADFQAILNNSVQDALTESQLFGLVYLSDEVFKKYPSKEGYTDQQRHDAAVEKWLRVESVNRQTNTRLCGIADQGAIGIADISMDDILDRAASFVRHLLGDVIDVSALTGSFSGGASTSRKRAVGCLASKYADKADVTQAAIPFVTSLLESTAGGWLELVPIVREWTIRNGNILFTVPKNAMIDRVACKEPDLNMFAQKAIGGEIRRRLRKVGINLNDQSRNQRYAKLGAETGAYATIDLSSASDSVSTMLVSRLLPPDWFYEMDRLRCEVTHLPDGTVHENQMFSSMGNGFTFELESLIFWAICSAVKYYTGVKGDTIVYGDDIIVPVECATSVIEVLAYCGFSTNVDKTFVDGEFRESCGKHYYGCLDVSPFYLRKQIQTMPDLIHFLNQFRAWCVRVGLNYGARYLFWLKWSKLIPNAVKGSTDYGDKTQLVCRGFASHRLVARTRAHPRLEQLLQTGLYVSWLNNPQFGSEVRKEPKDRPITIPRLTSEIGELELRRKRWGSTWERPLLEWSELWIEEL